MKLLCTIISKIKFEVFWKYLEQNFGLVIDDDGDNCDDNDDCDYCEDDEDDDDDDDDDDDVGNGGKFTQIADPIQVFPIQPAHCSIRFDDNKPRYLCLSMIMMMLMVENNQLWINDEYLVYSKFIILT